MISSRCLGDRYSDNHPGHTVDIADVNTPTSSLIINKYTQETGTRSSKLKISPQHADVIDKIFFENLYKTNIVRREPTKEPMRDATDSSD